MENPMVTSLISLGATFIGTMGTIIVAFITNRSSKKTDEINKKIDNNILNQDKRFLIQFMDKAERGKDISDEEMKVAFETKDEYNALGGDSYVDTKWDKLLEKEIIKLV